MAEPEPLLSLTRRDVRERHRAQRLRDAWPRAAYRLVSPAVPVQLALLLQELLALPRAHADESGSLQAQSSRVPPALRRAAVPQVYELEPWMPLGLTLPVLPVRLALPLSPREPQAHSVSQRTARSLAAVLQARRVSSARPSLLLPSLLFPLEQSLPLALLLRRRPESSCAPFQRRPRGSSSSASSFP